MTSYSNLFNNGTSNMENVQYQHYSITTKSMVSIIQPLTKLALYFVSITFQISQL